MNNAEVHFLIPNMVILGLSKVLFEVRNRIESRESPIRIQGLGKYKIIVLYFYINLMLWHSRGMQLLFEVMMKDF